MASYMKRQAVGDPAEWVYQIDPQGFFVRDAQGVVQKAHWTDLVELRLAQAPSKDRPFRHVTVVVHRNGRTWAIDNVSAISAAEYEDRSPDYAPFIRALFAEIGQRAPYARVKRGNSFLGYWSIVVAIGLLVAIGAGLLIAVPVTGAPALVSGLLKLALLFLFVIPLWGWLADIRPRGVRISQLPDSAYPTATRYQAPPPAPAPATQPVEIVALPQTGAQKVLTAAPVQVSQPPAA
jgi:hypothetical protein